VPVNQRGEQRGIDVGAVARRHDDPVPVGYIAADSRLVGQKVPPGRFGTRLGGAFF
jgi:hypothetical protein